MKIPRVGWIVADLAALAVVAAVVVTVTRPSGGAAPTPSEGPLRTITLDGKTANFRGEIDLYIAKDFEAEIETGLFYYEPTVVIAPPQFQILLEVGNDTRAKHTFTAPGLGIDKELKAFEQTISLVNTGKPGTYFFFCRYHADQGMRGAIRIGEEPF
ncbi:MAG: cupredoxin domain-containing protein [Actinomycetota bacterium]